MCKPAHRSQARRDRRHARRVDGFPIAWVIASTCTIVAMAPHRNPMLQSFRAGNPMLRPRHTRYVISLMAAVFTLVNSPSLSRTEDAVAAPDAPVLVRARMVAET